MVLDKKQISNLKEICKDKRPLPMMMKESLMEDLVNTVEVQSELITELKVHLSAVLNSTAVKEAPFYGYSEAVKNAMNLLKKLES